MWEEACLENAESGSDNSSCSAFSLRDASIPPNPPCLPPPPPPPPDITIVDVLGAEEGLLCLADDDQCLSLVAPKSVCWHDEKPSLAASPAASESKERMASQRAIRDILFHSVPLVVSERNSISYVGKQFREASSSENPRFGRLESLRSAHLSRENAAPLLSYSDTFEPGVWPRNLEIFWMTAFVDADDGS